LNKITNALISVSDKTDILEFAKFLADKKITIFSTGGTAEYLKNNKINTINIEDYTNFPEIMEGRVKTLNPKIHGGILARRDKDSSVMKTHGILPIDLVIVNLYPFKKVIANPNCKLDEAIENIDIGGPAMLRSAAKNHAWVSVIVDNKDYQNVMEEINKNDNTTADTRAKLALKAFAHTASYDGAIANYLSKDSDGFADNFNLQFKKIKSMRYGENPHQKAALYVEQNNHLNTQQLQGKDMSYNNAVDADVALECALSFDDPCCVIVKHANPCGVALAKNIHNAYIKAFKSDPSSAFGGVIAFNREIDETTIKEVLNTQFVEVIIAPGIKPKAIKLLATKKNIRVLKCNNIKQVQKTLEYKKVSGALLIQDKDLYNINKDNIHCVSEIKPNKEQINDLLFAWKVAKMVKSNAIVYAKNKMTIGIGAGQMSRIYSTKIAAIKAKDEGLSIKDSVMASDAFFPFSDNVKEAAKEGIKAIIQPGGSVNDNQVIQAANENNIIMVFTKIRHFKH
jgi:phosphoribosylaminoimidazolecarboxamide formyltransferase/IMP cyclohydrolase